MVKAKIGKARLELKNNSIVIYYNHVSRMRFPTWLSVCPKKDRNRKFSDWDFRLEDLKSEFNENGLKPGCYMLKTQTSKSAYTNRLIIE